MTKMVLFLFILGLVVLTTYLIKLIIIERDYQVDLLNDIDDCRENIEAIEIINNSVKKEFDLLKEELIRVKADKQQIESLLRTQNQYFRGVLYDKQNDTIVLSENLERIGEL